MEFIIKFFENILLLANAMSFYILLGLLIAGVLKQLIPEGFIIKHLGKSKIASVIKATILGIPMPVCSCSVIPLAKSLQKEGASRGAVQSFMISTPITGVDSILATYSFFGWFFTLYRVVTSTIIAIIAGVFQNYFDKREEQKTKFKNPIILNSPKTIKATQSFKIVKNSNSCEDGCSSCDNSKEKRKSFTLKESFKYGYQTLFKDIYKSLFIGLILGAIFTTIFPKELLGSLFEYKWITYIAVLFIAMPLYVCATASLPIAASFILSGMSGGGAFVFLTAGPATNSVTMGVVASMFGKKSLFLYLGVISIFSILFGYLFDLFFSNIEVIQFSNEIEKINTLDTISSIIMFGLIGYYFLKERKFQFSSNIK